MSSPGPYLWTSLATGYARHNAAKLDAEDSSDGGDKPERCRMTAEPEKTPSAETTPVVVPKEPVVAADGDLVSDGEFETVCQQSLGAVGGVLLFKLRVGRGVECQHVAAGVIGEGPARQFLVLSLPVAGGKLSVETAARSRSPVAGIAAAYAGLAEAFAHAA